MDDYGLYGPFQNPDDIDKFWYEVTEKELEKSLKLTHDDLKEARKRKAKSDIKIYEQDIKNLEEELNNLRKFVEEYQRCLERYKYDKKTLEQIQKDWKDYNFSLYTDWNRIRVYMLDSSRLEGKALENNRKIARLEVIKREEIERRVRKLLSG